MSEVEDNPYDVERFRRVMAGITDDALDMDVWAQRTPCGTVACLAGHVVLEAGTELVFTENATDGRIEASKTITGQYVPVLASELLVPGPPEPTGLDDARPSEVRQARIALRNLFMSSARTKDELWDAIEDYTEGMVTRA